MTIVCGTDLTSSAARAAHAAAAFAHRLGVPLKLVHVLDEMGAELNLAERGEAAYADTRVRMRAEVERLRKEFGIEADAVVLPGRADAEIISVAIQARAELVVVAAVGRTLRHRWLLGSVAEQVASRSPIPVLVVRDDTPLVAWARGERSLATVLGVDPTAQSRAALDWCARLRSLSPCYLRIVHVVSPADEHRKLVGGTDLEPALLRDLQTWVGTVPGAGETKLEILPRTDDIDLHLTQLAQASDLVVVGAHQRAHIDRWWHGSVSRGVLKHASSNVACIPRGEASLPSSARPIREVLVPTDLSPLANRAIAVAYAMVPPDGVVHLIHVVRGTPGSVREIEHALRELVPADSLGTVATHVEVVQADDAAAAICQAAERLGVDAVCMATRRRSRLAELVRGSHAQRVVAGSEQPVVLVPPKRAA